MNASKLETLLLIVNFKCTLFWIIILTFFNILPKIKCNSVSLKLCPSNVVYSRYIVTVVLFQIELSSSTIFWDSPSIFKILTFTILYYILTEYNVRFYFPFLFNFLSCPLRISVFWFSCLGSSQASRHARGPYFVQKLLGAKKSSAKYWNRLQI